jgi:hypothetical protein
VEKMNRTICDVLEEMRACNKTKNYAGLDGLIEEAQSMANRMEAGLYDQKDFQRMKKDYKELKKKLEKAEEDYGNLAHDKGEV